jgi:hypothetical protein
MCDMQKFIDPTIIHELQASQDEILDIPTYSFPTSGDLIMASEKVMNNVVILFHSFELMNIEYPKTLSKHYNQYFLLFDAFLKGFGKIWK